MKILTFRVGQRWGQDLSLPLCRLSIPLSCPLHTSEQERRAEGIFAETLPRAWPGPGMLASQSAPAALRSSPSCIPLTDED